MSVIRAEPAKLYQCVFPAYAACDRRIGFTAVLFDVFGHASDHGTESGSDHMWRGDTPIRLRTADTSASRRLPSGGRQSWMSAMNASAAAATAATSPLRSRITGLSPPKWGLAPMNQARVMSPPSTAEISAHTR